MNNYEIFNETNLEIDLEEEKKFIEYFLKYKKLKNVTFNVIFVNNETIREINRDFRGKDSETDVVSFALEDNENIKFDFGRLLGDIYISVPQMKLQASKYKHSETREMIFLTAHGLLHLLGYDHMTTEEENKMFNEQEMILDGYGITR